MIGVTKYFYTISVILFLFTQKRIEAQQIVQFNSGDGLMNGTINVFAKDSLGYMWIGTDQGLNRYSGTEFKNYLLKKRGPSKVKGVSDMINLNGDLYVISSNGSLFKYHYDLDRFEELFSDDREMFLSIASSLPKIVYVFPLPVCP